MPPDMSISMRYTKLKAEEAALIAGEVTKPSWESRNEGIHERVSFEDTLWGFDLAGGIYYRTPLRITFVKPDSRAEKAGIKPGDRLVKINDVDTSTLTIQEAHDMIVASGIHIKLSVTSPDDFEDVYYFYEDPIVEDYDSEEERRLEEEKARKRRVRAKVSSYWSLQWPWVSRRRLIYRESNCFMVPSKYEEERRDKYPIRPSQRYFDDIILYDNDDEKEIKSRQPSKRGLKSSNAKLAQEVLNGDADEDFSDEEDNETNIPTIVEQNEEVSNEIGSKTGKKGDVQIEDITEELDNNYKEKHDLVPENEINDMLTLENKETNDVVINDIDISSETRVGYVENSVKENDAIASIKDIEPDSTINNEINDDQLINEVLGKSDGTSKSEEENILDSILSDDGQNLENSESMNER